MEYREFGKTKLKISKVGLGFMEIGSTSWKGKVEKSIEIIKAALEVGINFFDTAEIYGDGKSEQSLGLALRELKHADNVIIATKVGGFRPTRYFIEKGIIGSIRRLGIKPTLLQLHWPPPSWIPLCETIKGLEKMIDKGFVDYIGVSNFSGKLLSKALHCTKKYEIISDQIEYNLVYRTPEIDLIPLAQKERIEIIAYSPLAKGALAGIKKPTAIAQRFDGKFKKIIEDKELFGVIEKISQEKNVKKSQIALVWLINKNSLPIPGTRNSERVFDFADSVNIYLDSKELNLLDKVSYRYITIWGNEYSNLKSLRYVPCVLQYIGIKAIGGV